MKYRQINHNRTSINLVCKRVLIFILALFVLPLLINHSYNAKADTVGTGTQVSVRLDWLEEIAEISPGQGGSSKFYISTDKMKTWENLGNTTTIDLSSIISSKAVTIYFKGNKDTNPLKVDLPGEDNSLKVKYEIVNGEGRIVISGTSYPVEYRKGNNGSWKTASNNMSTSLYEIKGATLHFRTVATATRRAGKIVSVKIPKRPAAPSVSLDPDKLYIKGLKPGQTQYRVGDSLNWITFTASDNKTNTLDLSALLTPGANNTIPAGIIEFRTLGSDKKLHSAIKTIEIKAQEPAPNNVSLTGNALIISDSDVKRNYEYAVVSQNTAVDLKNIKKWVKVTAGNNPIIIRDAFVGDKVLVRVKSSKTADTKEPILASAYKEFTVKEITQAK